MSVNVAIHILETCGVLGLLWVFWNYGWQRFALDQLRQDLFSARDSLFDLASDPESGLRFDSCAYGAMRSSLNRQIRFAHRLTFHHIWLTVALAGIPWFKLGKLLRDYTPNEEIEIEALSDPELKKKLKSIRLQAGFAFLRYSAISSPMFILLLVVGFFCALVTSVIKHSFKSAIRLALGELKERELTLSVRAVGFQSEALSLEPK